MTPHSFLGVIPTVTWACGPPIGIKINHGGTEITEKLYGNQKLRALRVSVVSVFRRRGAGQFEALFLQAELPPAVLAFRRFRRTMQAGRADTGVDGSGKRFEFHRAYALTRKIRKPLAPPGFLDPANVHEEAQAFSVLRPFHPLRVDDTVHAQSQRLFQRVETAPLRDMKRGHDAACLSRSKSFPGACVQFDCGLHAEALLGCQEPAPVMGQPVLGEHFERAQKVFAAHRIESCLGVIAHVRFTPAAWPHFACNRVSISCSRTDMSTSPICFAATRPSRPIKNVIGNPRTPPYASATFSLPNATG